MRADTGHRERHISLHIPQHKRNVLRLWKRLYQAIRHIFHWNCNENTRKKGKQPIKMYHILKSAFSARAAAVQCCILMKDISQINVRWMDNIWLNRYQKIVANFLFAFFYVTLAGVGNCHLVQISLSTSSGTKVKPLSTDLMYCFFSLIHFQGTLDEIQGILNTTEISLHQLTALVDCRSLHMVSRDKDIYKLRHSYRSAFPHLRKVPGDWSILTSM